MNNTIQFKMTNAGRPHARFVVFALLAGGLLAVPSAFSTAALTPKAYPGVRVEKNLAYGPRQNLPNEGAAYPTLFGANDEFGLPVNRHETAQTYDVYYPAKCGPEMPVLLLLQAYNHPMAYVCNTLFL